MTEEQGRMPATELNAAQKQAVVDAVNQRGISAKCPRCAPGAMTLVDGLVSFSLQGSASGFILGGPGIPSVALACNHCGYLEFHALGALGLLTDVRFSEAQSGA